MTVYNVDSRTRIPTPTPTNEPPELATLRAYAARLERRSEYGAGISDSARAWIAKDAARLALWYELLANIDEHGFINLESLQAWCFFDTRRKRQYVLKQLADYGVIKKLDGAQLQVIV